MLVKFMMVALAIETNEILATSLSHKLLPISILIAFPLLTDCTILTICDAIRLNESFGGLSLNYVFYPDKPSSLQILF